MDGEAMLKPLGSLVENFDARRVPLSRSEREKRPGNIPYYGPTGILDYIETELFDGTFLLVAEDGSVERDDGTVFRQLVGGKFWANNHTHVLRAADKRDTIFLYYALGQVPIRPFISGSVQDKLTQASLNRVLVPFPEPKTRYAIVELLRALDDKIEFNRRMAETLRVLAGTLFKSWFVDFDPVCAKAKGCSTGLSVVLAALFPERFGQDGLPEGWELQQLSQIVVQDRATVDPAILGETLVEHFSLPAFDAGQRPSIEPSNCIKSLKLSLSAPLVLFSKLNPETPRVWVVQDQAVRPMMGSTEFLALRPSNAAVPLSFLEGLLASDPFRKKAMGMVTGTSKSHQRVQPASLLRTEWPIPPASILAAFAAVAEPVLARRLLLGRESATLADLRDALLPKLISGALSIADAERTVAAA
ncbi:restriction endonuclease subunit S [Sabulicella rubraurantiaca]|uniref:restriction endonuclease subunit S n=1 Tax=Sabulicella rubraurantiaca TaxID=2811429 RepID=UPI001A958341|nr:restriction endonuclease subunit S [Sabulicella rubraurantiaca]